MSMQERLEILLVIIGIICIPPVYMLIRTYQVIRDHSVLSAVYQVSRWMLSLMRRIPTTLLRMWSLRRVDPVSVLVSKLFLIVIAFPFVFVCFLLNDELL